MCTRVCHLLSSFLNGRLCPFFTSSCCLIVSLLKNKRPKQQRTDQNYIKKWIRILAWNPPRRGVTCAHSIIIVDHLGKGSSLPFKQTIGRAKTVQKKNITKPQKVKLNVAFCMDQISGLNPPKRDYICAQYNRSRSSGERIFTSIQTNKQTKKGRAKNTAKQKYKAEIVLRIADGSDFWLESSDEGLHLRTV